MILKFFTYYQNNSRGVFTQPGRFVIIQAENAQQANKKAQEYGIYFDGAQKGLDCGYCGDRWFEAIKRDGREKPRIYGVTIETIRKEYQQFQHLHLNDVPFATVYYTTKKRVYN